jgi:hypothetical protein
MLGRLSIQKPHFLWLMGLYVVGLYIFFLQRFKGFLRFLLSFRSTFVVVWLVFFVIQLVSVFVSTRLDFFSIDRAAAIIHNILVYLFVLFGYYCALEIKGHMDIFRPTGKIFKALIALSLAAFMLSLIFQVSFYYRGPLSLLGFVSNYTNVTFSTVNYFFGLAIPRTLVMGLYFNSAAILMFLLFIINYIHQEQSEVKRNNLILYVLLFAGVLTTGSRIAVIAVVALIPFLAIKNVNGLIIATLVIIFLAVILAPIVPIIAEIVLAGRESSNSTRASIYTESLKLMLDNNFLLGIGIKPYIHYVSSEYPVGSHSSVIGYIVKNGVLGAVFALGLYLYIIANFFFYYLAVLFRRIPLDKGKMITKLALFLLFVIYLLEDFDAYEPIAFYTGALFALDRR